MVIKNAKKKYKKLYIFLKRIEFLLPPTYSNRKYFRNLLNFKKFRKNPSLITDVSKRNFLFFFSYLKKIRGKEEKLKYLKWFSKHYNLHFNYDINQLDNSKEQLNTLYYSKTLKGKLDNSKPYNVFSEKKNLYKIKRRNINDIKVYKYNAKKRTNN